MIYLRNALLILKKNSSDINHQAYYLNSLYYSVQILQAQHKYKEANQLNNKCLKLSKDSQNDYFIHYFTYLKGIQFYLEKEYQQSIAILTNELDYLKDQQDSNTLSLAYFYIGKSYEAINEVQKAVIYFEK